MKVSIITIVLNNKDYIRSAIDSVLAQSYKDIEYIVVDGQSTDGTFEIIESYGSQIAQVFRGKDGGIYPAMNKGLKAATGEIVGILNADDLYASTTVIEQVVNAFIKNKEAQAVYGDLQYVERDNLKKVLRHWSSGHYKKSDFLWGWMPPHPTFFVKRKVYEQFGYFDTRLKSAADYELMLRFLFKNSIKAAYIPEVLVKMRAGGKSNASVSNRLKANKEDRLAWEFNALKPYPFTLLLKPLRKLPQFLSKWFHKA